MLKSDKNFLLSFIDERKAPSGEMYSSLSLKSTHDAAHEWNCSLKQIEILALQNQIVPERYQRNIGTIGFEGQLKLLQSRVAIIGLGGLGGSVLEMLLRWGIGNLVAVDGDIFADSNLNRQILSRSANLAGRKAEAARLRAEEVNPAVDVNAHDVSVDDQNLPGLLQGCHVVVDCLDNIRTRFVLEKACKRSEIPFIHGAIAGFMGQVSSIFPEDTGLEAIYGSRDVMESGAEKDLGTPCVTPAAVAAWQVSEAVKILLGWESSLRNKILFFDLKDLVITIVELS